MDSSNMIGFTECMRLEHEQYYLNHTTDILNPLCGTHGRGTPPRATQTGPLKRPPLKYIHLKCTIDSDECGFECACKEFKKNLNRSLIADSTGLLKKPCFYIKLPESGAATKLTNIVAPRIKIPERFAQMYVNIYTRATTGKCLSHKTDKIPKSQKRVDTTARITDGLIEHYAWLQTLTASERSWKASRVHQISPLVIQQNVDGSVTIAIVEGAGCTLQRKYPRVKKKDISWRKYQTRRSSPLKLENFPDGRSTLHVPALSHFYIPTINPPNDFSRNNL